MPIGRTIIQNKSMNKISIIILSAILSLTPFANKNDANGNSIIAKSNNIFSAIKQLNANNKDENLKKREDELTSKIKNLCEKEIIKSALQGKKLNKFVKDRIDGLTNEERKNIERNVPGLSLDESNFESDTETYKWLAFALKGALKYYTNNGTITQYQFDQFIKNNKIYMTLLGLEVPDIEIKKGMSDSEIENLAILIVDAVNKVTDPIIFKILGIDLNNLSNWKLP